MNEIILDLYALGFLKFGSFEVKKDFLSPFQLDLQGVLSHPTLAKEMCTLFWEKLMHLSFDILSGVPPIANCFATFIAWEQGLPYVTAYEKKVVGRYKTGQKCLILQDLDASGLLTLDVIDIFEEEGLVVRDVLTFLDLGLGGKKKIKSRGYVHHAIVTMEDVLQVLVEKRKLPGDQYKVVVDFLESMKETK